MRNTLFSLLLASTCAPSLAAQSYYPFALDQDAVSGAVDFSALNRPIGPPDRVFALGGKFFAVGPDLQPGTADDVRVRFYGVNLAFGGNFPTEADAERIARRLRKLGVNMVRLHHMDTQPDGTPSNSNSILTTGPYPTLNPVAVTRLRRFIEALKSEGVYVNLNLHVGYVFRPTIDNIPALNPFPGQSKPVRMIHPRMIALQEEFTRNLITALQLNDDPALGVVEINNETSLVYHWQTNSLEPNLVGEYAEAFRGNWNEFLTRRYETTARLREAWGGSEPDGNSVLPDDWRIENQPNARVRTARNGDEFRVEAPEATRPIIVKQVGFSVEEGQTYVAEVEMRIDAPAGTARTVYWDVKQDVSPWRSVSGQNVSLTSAWQRYRMVITPTFAMDRVGRFGISIERVGLPVVFRNWRLYPVGRRGLNDSESLEEGTVSLPMAAEAGSGGRTDDYLLFLADRDKSYLNTMLRAVRETAGPLVPVTGTQVGFGGMLNYDSHNDLDYQDNHYYVDHPAFPNVAWDNRDWRIRDTSNVGSGADVFARMAATAQAGRPFTVSEFNQAWPNRYAAECDPTLAVFARFQDWDGIMHFAYAHNRNWDEGVPNGFDLNGDWTKWVSFGQSAWLFRSDAIEAGKETLEIPVSLSQRLRHTRERRTGNVSTSLTAQVGYDPSNAFLRPVRIAPDSPVEMPETARAKPASPYVAGPFTYDRENRLWLIHAPQAAGVIGFTAGKNVAAGALSVESGAFVSVLATSLDGLPLEQSARILVTHPGQALRSQPGASPVREQRIVNYPGTTDWWTVEPDLTTKPSGRRDGGLKPVWMQRIEAFITIRTDAPGIRVYPLDGRGMRGDPLDSRYVERADGGFRIHLHADGQPPAPWYEVTR